MNSYDISGKVDKVDVPSNPHVKPGDNYKGCFTYDKSRFTLEASSDHITYSGPGEFWFSVGKIDRVDCGNAMTIRVYPDKIIFTGEDRMKELQLTLTLRSSFAVSPIWDIESVSLWEGPAQMGIAFSGSKINC